MFKFCVLSNQFAHFVTFYLFVMMFKLVYWGAGAIIVCVLHGCIE